MCISSDDEHSVKRTDFHNAVYFTGDVAAAAAAESTRNDEVQISNRWLQDSTSVMYCVFVFLLVFVRSTELFIAN